jgi:hypothetical protein
MTLQDRIAGKASRVNIYSRRSTLMIAEEDAIMQYILYLDSRGFSPQKADVEDIANLLLAKRNT